MKPNGGSEPGGRLADEIKIYFGSFKEFKEKFSQGSLIIQGSGWGWLVYNQTYSRLEFKAMPDQTSPWTPINSTSRSGCLGACILFEISKQTCRLY